MNTPELTTSQEVAPRSEERGLRHEADWANIARMSHRQMQSYLRILGAERPMSTEEWRNRTSD